MITVDLRRVFERQADETKRAMAARLAAGVGVNGRPLAPKARNNGRPLGGATVPAAIDAAKVTVRADGFVVSVEGVESTVLNQGRQRGKAQQPPRKFLGISRADRRRFRQEAEDEVARQITAQIDRGAS